jgi:hypothetical protein
LPPGAQPGTVTSTVKTKTTKTIAATAEAILGKMPFIKNLLLSLETFLRHELPNP